jgi:hypothetical protein
LISGCPTGVTEEQARTTCAANGFSDADFNDIVNQALADRAQGLSASESEALFRGDCENDICTDESCVTECGACTAAAVNFAYSK